jgi:hypothetical protein
MINPQYEDLTRYTAPPDSIPEPPTYLLSQIIRYVESMAPNPYHYQYSIEEIVDLFNEASDNLTDEEYGIDTV